MVWIVARCTSSQVLCANGRNQTLNSKSSTVWWRERWDTGGPGVGGGSVALCGVTMDEQRCLAVLSHPVEEDSLRCVQAGRSFRQGCATSCPQWHYSVAGCHCGLRKKGQQRRVRARLVHPLARVIPNLLDICRDSVGLQFPCIIPILAKSNSINLTNTSTQRSTILTFHSSLTPFLLIFVWNDYQFPAFKLW